MMKRAMIGAALCVLLTPFGHADEKTPEQQAQAWLAKLGDKGLVLTEKSDNSFEGRRVAGRKSTMFVFQQDGWYLSLGFSGAVDSGSSIEELRAKFSYVALDRLPTPGLEIPGWEIRPQTPQSSFKKGVVLESLKDGKLVLRVKTRFFALYGRDPRVLVPADAPTPKGAYFQIRQAFPLDLTLAAPFSMKRQ